MDLRKIPPAVAEILGGIILVLPLVIGSLRGQDLTDLLFNRVILSLRITLFLRTIFFPLFLLGLILVIIGITLAFRTRHREKIEGQIIYLRLLLYFLSGYMLITWLLHWILDAIFYRGAFVTLTFVIGIVMLVLLLLELSIDQTEIRGDHIVRQQKIGKILRYTLLIILALIIVVPTLLPMSGVLASPANEEPVYGAQRGDYEVDRVRYSNQVSANITPYLLPDNRDNNWYSYVYYPTTIGDSFNMPVILFAHGFSGTDPIEYENTFYQLASQGAVVIYTQYVTNVELGGEFNEPSMTNFTSSNAMYFRYFMTWNGMKQAVETLLSEDPLIGNLDLSHLMIIGHSVGGGMVPYLAIRAVQQGWGGQMLILDLETPWFTGTHPLITYNLSILPDHTLVNIAGSEDDHLASPCIGMGQYEEFHTVLPENNLAYVINRSDRHGFPRLVATHYLITARINDHLTLWGYLKRVDAMTVMLFQRANNNPISTTAFFLEGGSDMIFQGTWTDNTPINPLVFSQDPFGIRDGQNIAKNYVDAHDMGPQVCQI